MNRPNTHYAEGLLRYSSKTFTIPSITPSRRPANIPLRTFSSTAESSHHKSTAPAEANEKLVRSSLSSSSDSVDSELSSWSDTGDLGEQLADFEDPLEIKLRESLDREVFGGSSRRHIRIKRTKYQDHSSHREIKNDNHAGFAREDIEIPNPGHRKISRVETIIANIMAGERQMHGLTGRPLVYGYRI